MIVTVTMNPAIDKTLDIDRFEHGGLNRIKHVELDAGGKGINVSKTIHELGGESIVTGFIAGNTGKIIQNVMDEWQMKSDFVEVEGETRTNTKVYEQNGLLTELNEPGPEIQKEDLQKLLSKLDGYAKEGTLFVLAGSVPKGIDNDIYRQIIEMVHKKGAKVLLDADGELFRTALSAKPDIIKPNRVELEQYEGMDYVASEAEVTRIAEKLTETIDQVVVSMGKSGAIFLTNGTKVKCPGLNVKAHSTVGAGDAMVAGLSYAWDQDLSPEETVKLCMAVSAGAVTTIGTKPPSRQVVDDLMKQVEIQPIEA
ncbi:MAG: 1-phosphofructokinase [Eubacteriales bacterium]|nr:1-phosphofructokinase [Eubacteriales bacterium]